MSWLHAFSVACWFVAFTCAWALFHPRVQTYGFMRTTGLGLTAIACVILSGWGDGSGGMGTMLLIAALSLFAVDYWARYQCKP